MDADDSGNFGDRRPGACADARAGARGRASARGLDVPGNPGNPGNANSIRDVPYSFFSRKERETGKSGKSIGLTDLAGRARRASDVIDFYEERAAIREFDGEMPRAEAEAAALRDVEQALDDGLIRSIPLDRSPRF